MNHPTILKNGATEKGDMEKYKQLAAFAGLLALLFVVVVADRRESEPAAQGQAQILANQSPEIRFVPAELPLFKGVELEDTWRRQVSSQLGETVPAEWRVYLVRGSRIPELLVETGRFMNFLHWTPDKTLWTSFLSFTPEHRPLSGGIRFDIFDSGFRARDFILDGGFISLYPSPLGTRVGFQLGSIFVFEGESASSLQGIGGEMRIRSWAPDGTSLLVASGKIPREFPSFLHLVPLSSGATTTFGPSTDQRLLATWSPKGDSLAYILNGSLYIFSSSTGTSQLLAEDFADVSGPQLVWSGDGKKILVAGRVMDLDYGGVQMLPLPAERIQDWAFSPNGRQIAITEHSLSSGSQLPCEGFYDNRIYLYDIQSNELDLLLDCAWARLRWLSDTRLLLAYPDNPEIPKWRVALLDTQTRELTQLTDGFEAREMPVISPDGQRLLVTGKRLRMYSATGQLLREIASPPGFDIARAAWATDSSMFAYVVGPEGFRCCL